ncbi:MAG: OmpA family protein [Alphaproteobacteria bacterium]|nr:OmpA family protein [Alphaproteobacteria bacterium]
MHSIQKRYFLALAATAMTLSTPAIAAEADNRDVVHDSGGHIVVNSFGNCVRTKWMSDADACGAAPPPKAVAAPAPMHATIAKEDRTVYFPFNKSALTPESRTKLNSLANTLKSDKQVKEARIFGYADRIGSVSYNDKLSKKRAETVRNYLESRGFVNSRVTETRWFGKSEPKTDCPNNLSRKDLIACLQPDRRVEVEIDYLPEGSTR